MRRSIKSGLPHKNLEENHIVHHHYHLHHHERKQFGYAVFSQWSPSSLQVEKELQHQRQQQEAAMDNILLQVWGGGGRVLMLLCKLLHAERISKLPISPFSGQVTVTLHLCEFGSLNTSHAVTSIKESETANTFHM